MNNNRFERDQRLAVLRLQLLKLRIGGSASLQAVGLRIAQRRVRRFLTSLTSEWLFSDAITSQLPVKAWHTYLDAPTVVDAILDHVVRSSHKIELKGKLSAQAALWTQLNTSRPLDGLEAEFSEFYVSQAARGRLIRELSHSLSLERTCAVRFALSKR